MIEFSWGHILVIAVVALVVIGPKELPTVLRTAGQWIGKIRRMAAEFQGQFQEALREAEMADLKQHFDDISSAAKSVPQFDPIGTVRKELEGAMADRPSLPSSPSPATPASPSLEATPADPPPPPAPAAEPEVGQAEISTQGPQGLRDGDAHDKAEGRSS